MFAFTFGDIGSGKTLKQAEQVLYLLHRSRRIEKKYKLPRREVWCNFHLNKELMSRNEGRLFYWHDPLKMIFEDYPINKSIRLNFDCVWDEMAVEIPSDKWKDTHPEIRRFFAQHRKRGIEIYGNTQDYMMLDINARRMATEVYETHKLLGSRDPSSTLPPLKFIWGLIAIWELDKRCIRQDDMLRVHVGVLPEFLFISKKLCNVYDTTEDVSRAVKNKLQHIELACDTCGKIKCEHIPI